MTFVRNNRAMQAHHHSTVAAEHEGQRIDNYLLRELKGVPRPLIYRLLRQGKIKLNGKKASPQVKLAVGDKLLWPPVRTAAVPNKVIPVTKLPPIVYEDDDYLIFNKPAGLAVHGGSGLSYGLIELARQLLPAVGLQLAHRLDKETSGLIVVSKSRRGLREFHAQLRAGQVVKHYVAIVLGQWSKKHSKITAPLTMIPADQGGRRVIVDATGMVAQTQCKCLNQHQQGALMAIELKTGRTHQARVHLAHVGHPILGDNRYGDRLVNRAADKAGCQGMFLHAEYLRFILPGDVKLREFHSPIPARFTDACAWLDQAN